MIEVRREAPEDAWEVEMLYDLSFAPGRNALSSYRLREGVEPARAFCLIARDEFGVLVAAIRYWPIRVGGAPALLLGPIAVHPTRQGEGLGAALMADSLDRARAAGWRRVLLVGDAPYYNRFGFSNVADRVDFPPPVNPARVLALALTEGGLDDLEGAVTRWNDDAPSPA